MILVRWRSQPIIFRLKVYANQRTSLEQQFLNEFDNSDLVFFTPWIKADPTAMQDISDFIEDHQFPSKMFSSQEHKQTFHSLTNVHICIYEQMKSGQHGGKY